MSFQNSDVRFFTCNETVIIIRFSNCYNEISNLNRKVVMKMKTMQMIARQFNQLNKKLLYRSSTYAVVYQKFTDYVKASSFLDNQHVCKNKDIDPDETCIIVLSSYGDDVVVRHATSIDDVLNQADKIPDVSALSYEMKNKHIS